jgi:hypothetical protein
VPGLRDRNGNEVRLFERTLHPAQTLLVFGGCEVPDEAVRAACRRLAAGLEGLPPDFIRSVFIQRGETAPEGIWAGDVLLDPEGAAHARYGAEGECLYLIRADGYVGYRAMPPLWSRLSEYLARIFGIPTET